MTASIHLYGMERKCLISQWPRLSVPKNRRFVLQEKNACRLDAKYNIYLSALSL